MSGTRGWPDRLAPLSLWKSRKMCAILWRMEHGLRIFVLSNPTSSPLTREEAERVSAAWANAGRVSADGWERLRREALLVVGGVLGEDWL